MSDGMLILVVVALLFFLYPQARKLEKENDELRHEKWCREHPSNDVDP